MIKRFVRRAAVEGLYEDTLPEERARAWTRNFPPNVARRMTRLGLMLGEVLREFPIEPADSVIYASSYGETIATERYLDSFPTASPLFFQTSIHPSAIEQVLINRACPVRELTPLTGRTHLAAQAALAALLTPGERVLLTGGEEIGGWSRKINAASDVAFTFALELNGQEQDALGALEWREKSIPTGAEEEAPLELEAFFRAIRDRRTLHCPSPTGGEIELTWF